MHIIKYGARGAEVAELQSALNRHGANIAEDGIFGEATEQALIRFQAANGLMADGRCGDATRAALAGRPTKSLTEADIAQAAAWYEKAAAQGHAKAQFNLGLLYGKGQGVAQDYGQARVWWEKAAAQGDAKAQYALGVLYDNGHGVAQDYGQARAWWEKAAAQTDDQEAQQAAQLALQKISQ